MDQKVAKSTSLRAHEFRAVINLVGECRELGDDWNGWLDHFNRTLMGLTRSESIMFIEINDPHSLQVQLISPPVLSSAAGFTFDRDRMIEATEYAAANPRRFDFIARYLGRMSADDGVALHNRDLFQADEWRATFDMQVLGEAYGTDPTLLCFRRMPRSTKNESLDVAVSRAKGRRNFTARDCALVREAVAAIAPLMGGPLARFADPSPADLAPRARQVLACMLEGDGDKQVAARLRISTHTVNQYAKTIFQHFGVRSRTELLARWIRRGWGDQFPWVDRRSRVRRVLEDAPHPLGAQIVCSENLDNG